MDFDSGWGDDEDGGDSWGEDEDGDDGWKRKKREAVKVKKEKMKMKRSVDEGERALFPQEENKRHRREVEEVEMSQEENKRIRRQAAAKWRKGTQPGEDVVAKVEKFRRGANYTAMWLPKMEWIKHRDESGEISSCDCE